MVQEKFVVSLMDKIAPEGLQRLRESDLFAVEKEAEQPDAIIVRSRTLPESIVDEPRLKCIARAGTGVDNIPVAAATRRGIAVFNAPGANSNAVKEAVIGSMIALSRHLLPASISLREDGHVDRSKFVGSEVAGRTLGILGLGQIGQRVAEAAVNMGMRVVGYDKYLSVPIALRLPPAVELAEDVAALLREADIVAIHVSLTEETRGMMNAAVLDAMKPGVLIINFARGEIVESADMRAALDSGQVGGYATDFPAEEYEGCERVLMTPHIGASTEEAQINCAEMATESLADFLLHGTVRRSVNFPMMQLQQAGSGKRLIYANENVPGMIGRVSDILAGYDVNILGMANQSTPEVGYSVVDCDAPPPQEALAAIRKVDGVRMVRLLPGER